MAKLLGFEQDPDAKDGAGMFTFESGQRYGYDPELAGQASSLKGALDASDKRTAGPGVGWADENAPVDGADFKQTPDQFRASLGVAPQAGSHGAKPLVASGGAQQFDRPMPSAPSLPPPQAGAPMPGPGPAPMAPPGIGDVSLAARDAVAAGAAQRILQGGRMMPGAAGRDPNRERRTGVMVPVDQSTKTEYGNPYSQDQAQDRVDADRAVMQSQVAGIELQAQQTENALLSQRAAAPMLAKQAAEQENAHNIFVAQFRSERGRFQQELDDYNKNVKVDPGKYFKDRGILGGIGMAIAQAMGAYASSMNGGPNFAMEIIQRGIDRDIDAQKDEIHNGRASRGNQLARMMDDYGWDMQQSEAALRIAQNKSAENQAALYALETKLPQYQVQADVIKAELARDTVKREQDLYNASLGKRTQTQGEAFVQPRAASGPTFKADTPEQQAGLLKLLPQGANVADLAPKDQLALVESYGEKKKEFASLRTTYEDLASAYGLKVDWNRGTLLDKNGNAVDPNESGLLGKNENIAGVGNAPSLLSHGLGAKQAINRTTEARDKATAITGKALSGASVSPQQAEMIQSYLLGDDDAGAVRGLQRAIVEVQSVERDTEASYPNETRAEYENRTRGINRERKQGPAPAKVNDY